MSVWGLNRLVGTEPAKANSPQESLREQLRETLIGEIRSAVAATAHALVVDGVLEPVGEPWSRKGEWALTAPHSTQPT